MSRLQCPVCATIVEVQPGGAPVCPSCGFGSSGPPAVVPAAPAPVAPPTFAETPPTAPSPPMHIRAGPAAASKKRPGFVIGVGVAAGILVIGGALAAVYVANPDALGGLVSGGGKVTEAELRSALRSFDTTTTSDSSDGAWGMVGSFEIKNPGEDSFLGAGSGTFRILVDRDGHAFEVTFNVQGGAVTVGFSVKQKEKVVNYVFGTQGFYGRDEDPSTQPEMDEFSEAEEGLTLDEILVDENLIVDSKQAIKHKGKPATKFSGHNETTTFEIVVYDKDRKLAYFKALDPTEGEVEVEVLYGREVAISVSTDHPRTSFQLGNVGTFSVEEQIVPADFALEAPVAEVEMRAVRLAGSGDKEDAEVVATMRLDEVSKTQGDVRFYFTDEDGDSLISAGDRYFFDGGSTGTSLAFYDLWANQYEGGPDVPGFGPAGVLLALGVGFAAWSRGRRAH